MAAKQVADEQTRLLGGQLRDRRSSLMADSFFSQEEQALVESSVGERLDYNEYTTIDWMHDLIKDSYRLRIIRNGRGIRRRLLAHFDACSGWIAVAIMGTLTACVAFIVSVCEATVSDWKYGYCSRNPFLNREACCDGSRTSLLSTISTRDGITCTDWQTWSHEYSKAFGIYLGFALAFGVISATATTFTKRSMPATAPGRGHTQSPIDDKSHDTDIPSSSKSLYMASGAGIAEIKCILSGFEIPHFLDFRVLFVKGFGAVFAVATGMCLGKEGPFVHISGCVGYLVAKRFPKYRYNGRKMREILSAAVAAGLSVAFGAPIGGVLFSYEEISTYFPRKVLWRAFLCSMCAAVVLKALNPNGTGKLVLFETDYGTKYEPYHYLAFVSLGIAGGIWGGLFCRLNFAWSKWFRSYRIIKQNPVFEVFLVVLVTVLLQYPNPLTRDSGDVIITNLLVNCQTQQHKDPNQLSWVCQNELRSDGRWGYVGWLILGCLVKLVLTIVTFGAKVPSGIIIPALDAGALFGRLLGQWISTISPGIFAMVGAGAFLAGVSRMTISLCVIMFELTGELEYVLPHMIAILVAKWVADAISKESVYDLTQAVLGHPFLDTDEMLKVVQKQREPQLVQRLIPPRQTMDEITVHVGKDNTVSRHILEQKLDRLKDRGLMDAGLVLVKNGVLQGYLGEKELDFGLADLARLDPDHVQIRLLGDTVSDHVVGSRDFYNDEFDETFVSSAHELRPAPARAMDLTSFVDRTPVSMCENAPMEYAVEAFGKLGLRHLLITEEGSGKLIGVCLKKRFLSYLEKMSDT